MSPIEDTIGPLAIGFFITGILGVALYCLITWPIPTIVAIASTIFFAFMVAD